VHLRKHLLDVLPLLVETVDLLHLLRYLRFSKSILLDSSF